MSQRGAESLISPEAFLDLVRVEMPGAAEMDIEIESLAFGEARLRFRYDPRWVRAGGTIWGPAFMLASDLALYAMTLSTIGLVPLAVTTDLTFHFLRRPVAQDVIAHARVVKRGARLVIGAGDVTTGADPEPVAHFVGTYSIPPAAEPPAR